MRWDEDKIRQEIAKIDEITGLEGSKLQIIFKKYDIRILACYKRINVKRFFIFNTLYYLSNEFSKDEALDTIRHEYAHYMDDIIYKGNGHGETWKTCCRLVGARPYEFYRGGLTNTNYYYELFLKESPLWAKYKAYEVGDIIEHPSYGTGIISDIKGEIFSRRLEVYFESGYTAYLSLPWVEKNCEKIT